MKVFLCWTLAFVLCFSSYCSACSDPLGMEDGSIRSDQLAASSIKDGLNLDFGRFNCCSAYNVSGIVIQKPADTKADAYLTEFSLEFELASSPPGKLSPYQENDTQLFQTTPDDMSTRFDWRPVSTRRIRINIRNYTSEACFRMEVLGCELSPPAVPVGIKSPDIYMSYTSLQDIKLKCDIKDEKSYSIQYYVTWWKGNDNVTSELLQKGQMSTSLTVLSSDFTLDTTYRCSVKACYTPGCATESFSDEQYSEDFKPEIKVVGENTLTITEGGPVNHIQIMSTVPPAILCMANKLEPTCTVSVKASIKSLESRPLTCGNSGTRLPQVVFPEQDSGLESCVLEIKDSNWNNRNKMAVLASLDGRIDSTRQAEVSLTTKIENTALINNIKTVQVTVKDADTSAVCMSVNDPHITMFDGGTFFRSCQNGLLPTCNCAVVVLVGDDVIRFDGCGAKDTANSNNEPLTVQMYLNGDLEPGVSIVRIDAGKQYQVYLPTGGHLTVEESLCGNYDFQNDNDLVLMNGSMTTLEGRYADDFSLSWRVPPNESIYQGFCPPEKMNRKFPTSKICDCSGSDTADCKTLGQVLTCATKKEFNRGEDVTEALKSKSRNPQNCYSEVSMSDGVFEYNATYTPVQCSNRVNKSKIASICDDVTPVVIQSEIDNCVDDIKLTGKREWTSVLEETLKRRCLFQLERNLTISSASNLLSAICPDDCSGNGVCVDGACTCNSGFIGHNCAVNSSIAPEITSLGGSGLCNTITSTCNSLINETSYSEVGEWKKAIVEFISKNEIVCKFPKAGNYLASVSNVALTNNTSDPALFISYNPVCYMCNANQGTCQQKSDSCVIDGQCYKNRTVNPSNHSEKCYPETSTTAWTLNTAEVSFLCKSVDFNLNKQECHLSAYGKSEVGTYFDQNSFGTSWSHSSWTCSADPCPGKKIEWNKFQSWKGYYSDDRNIETLTDTWTIEDCRMACELNKDCKAVKYLQEKSVCVLADGKLTKNSTGKYQNYPGWEYHYFMCKEGEKTGPFVSNVKVIPDFKGVENDDFTCRFDSAPPSGDSNGRQIVYDVLWKVDGVYLYDDTADDNVTESHLPSTFANSLQDGSTVQCAVSACYYGNCDNTRGKLVFSNIFTATIMVKDPESLTLYEGEDPKTFELDITAPTYVLCKNRSLSSNENCTISLSAFFDSNSDDKTCINGMVIEQVAIAIYKLDSNNKKVSGPSCKIDITMDNWNQYNYVIEVKATTDNKYDGNFQRRFKLIADYSVNGASEEKDVMKKNIMFDVVDRDRLGICGSVNDPHIVTFDGLHYNTFYEGEFTFYKHLELPYSVHTFYRSCNGKASCNCAVAIKAGDDVILIDKCGPKSANSLGFYPITYRLYRNGQLTPGFKLLRFDEGRKFLVILPTGTTVHVKRTVIRAQNFLNVWIKPSAADYKKTKGLCGSFNDDKNDDLTLANGTLYTGPTSRPYDFSKSWRVEQKNTLYTGSCPTSNALEETAPEQPSYCYCNATGNVNCGPGYDIVTCPFETADGVDITSYIQESALYPTKCLPGSLTKHDDFEYDPNYVTPVGQWPSGGFSEAFAKISCQFHLEASEAVQVCKNLPGIDLQSNINNCLKDIQLTTDIKWSFSAVEDVKTQCAIQLAANISLWNQYTDIMDKMCIAECNAAGNCTKGQCQCIEGRGGLDCFTFENDPPTLFYLNDDGLCDMRTSQCDIVTVYNNNTLNIPTLSCHFKKLLINESTYMVDEKEIIVQATYVTFNELTCKLPAKESYQVRISNDKKIISAAANLIVYDSLCYSCDKTTVTCQQKVTYAFLETCFTHKKRALNGKFLKLETMVGIYCGNFLLCHLIFFKNIFNFIYTFVFNAKLWINYNFVKAVYIHLQGNPCGKRDVTWKRTPGKAILGYDKKTINNIYSQNQCKRLCLQETDFLCRSFEFQLSAGLCTLSDTTASQHSSLFVRLSGFSYEEWECDTEVEVEMPPGGSIENYTLACSFPSIKDPNRTLEYHVYWLINNDIVQDKVVMAKDNTVKMYMDNSHLKAEISIIEGGTGKVITAQLTIPPKFMCNANIPSEKCSVIINSQFNATMDPNLICSDRKVIQQAVIGDIGTNSNDISCGVRVTNSNWRSVFSIPVKAKIDGLYDGEQSRILNIEGQLSANGSLSNATLFKDIKVKVKNVDVSSVCRSVNDPHITTFDGRYYDNFNTGEFVLFNHKSLPYKVHVLYRKCRGKASCNCAVYIQSGDDVIVIDRCGPKVNPSRKEPFKIYLYKNGELTPGTKIYREADGRKFRVFLPTGTRITVKVGRGKTSNFMNLFDGGYNLTVTTYTVPALLVSYNEIVCPVPNPGQSYKVEVSNNNDTFSEELVLFTSYSKECHTCRQSGICDFKTYNTFYEGEFTFYKHLELPYSVHTFYRSCNGKASCNCAVAIKAGADVILIDKCGPKSANSLGFYPITYRLYRNGQLTPGFKLLRFDEGRDFANRHNCTCKRTVIRAQNFLNVWIKPSAADYKKTKGLCGSFNDDKMTI
ncbi:hypothetical protein KUTeg_004694 [Tegillarca granosa]|uniref:Uncharacterized protein n=1 Tax=Tegillarca granosa TaxID=220873 RepID=A0ABQ9FHK4_TEGGR|nr:hypothetical protein KUTeg_004694 [Tegillarca granosa]